MNWADIAILVIVALSAAVGFVRGFLREAIGLASWALAFYLAFTNAQAAAGLLARWIDSGSVRVIVAFAVIFIAVLIAGAIINYILGRLASKTGFSGTDRTLGGAFGVVRGIVILVLLTLLAGGTSLPRDNWWQESLLIGNLQDGAVKVRSWLPDQYADDFVFPSEMSARALDLVPTRPDDASPTDQTLD